jgi:hypothetical protein
LFQGDSGYQGILRLHKNSEVPKKKPRGGTLSAEEKLENRRISRERVFVENVIAKLRCLSFWQTSIVTGVNVTNYVQP